MRRFSCLLALSALFSFSACGDDKPKDPVDTVSPSDTVAGDVATLDTVAPDTATQTDVTPPLDVAIVPDTIVLPDTTIEPPDQGEGTCLGMRTCVDACITEDCKTDCLAASDSAAELAALTALNTCITDNACAPTSETPTDAEVKASFNCARSHCLAETVTCYQGETKGSGTCPEIRGCVQRCDDDARCERGCFESATTQNVESHFQLEYCLESQCYSSSSLPQEIDSCKQDAQTIQPCSVDASQCGTGIIGAGPGAGAGGHE